VKLSNALSRERVTNGLKSLGKLRIKTTHASIITIVALLLILFVAFTVRIFPLRWEQLGTGQLQLSEFDSFFEYHVADYMVKNGLLSPYWPTQWIDTQFWYPNGINMATETLPSIPFTGAFVYDVLAFFGVNVSLMTLCSLLPVLTGTLCVLIMYFIGKDMGGKLVGLLAALFLALEPSFISRSNLGWFETEMTTFSFLLFFLMFQRAIDGEKPIGSTVKYSLACAACLAYSVMGWGAAYYLLDLTVLFVFVLILLKRYTPRILLAYSLTFGIGLLIAIQAPFLSSRYLTSFAVIPVAVVFILLCLNEALRNLSSMRERFILTVAILAALIGGFIVISASGYVGDIAGKFMSVINPFLRSSNPTLESVAEHRIASWASIYYDLGIGILFFAVGLYFSARNLTNKNIFLLLFGLTGLYFAGSMVRLTYILSLSYAVLAAIGVVGILRPFMTLLKEPPRINVKKKIGFLHVSREYSGIAVFLIFIVLMTNLAVSPQSGGGIPNGIRSAYTPITISAGSLAIIPNGPVREWSDMLVYLNNLQNAKTVVVAWWDYGLWITVGGNVTTLCDNTTINDTAIQNVGFAFMANETYSLRMLKQYNVQYILVFVTFYGAGTYTGTYIDYAGGDNGKWTWMAKISGGAMGRFLKDGNIDQASMWQNETTFGNFSSTTNAWEWNYVGQNTTVYKLMSYAKNRWCTVQDQTDPDAANVTAPIYFQEAFFSGENLSPTDSATKYGGVVPLVALYKIDWQKYYQDENITAP
jgi:dolichyl-diphosphooligosaccharide--protein glycosyltransferase